MVMLLAKECTGNNNNYNNKKKNNYYYSHVGTSGLDLKIPGKVRFFLIYFITLQLKFSSSDGKSQKLLL